jgi:hypothetical protein
MSNKKYITLLQPLLLYVHNIFMAAWAWRLVDLKCIIIPFAMSDATK